MDVDDTPAPLICFICGGPEKPTQKLVQVTQKGLLTYVEVVGNATILERMEAWNIGRLRYQIECKRDLNNKVTKKSARV